MQVWSTFPPTIYLALHVGVYLALKKSGVYFLSLRKEYRRSRSP